MKILILISGALVMLGILIARHFQDWVAMDIDDRCAFCQQSKATRLVSNDPICDVCFWRGAHRHR